MIKNAVNTPLKYDKYQDEEIFTKDDQTKIFKHE